jgi:hypothetical protein
LCCQVLFNGFVEIQSGIKGQPCTFKNSPGAESITSLLAAIYLLILLVFVFISIFIDAIVFTKERGCRPKNYFSDDDPFGFRFQFYVNFLAILAATIGSILKPALYFIKPNLNSNSHTWDQYYNVFINSVYGIGYTLSFGCFGVIVVCFQKIQKRSKSNVYESVFDALINDKKGKEIFKRYSRSEWSLENILFFEDVERYKNAQHLNLLKEELLKF